MKKISQWASQHIIISRWLIVFLCTLLHTLGAILGLILYAEVGDISRYWQLPFWLILGVLFFYLPHNQVISYQKRNIFTGIIYFCCFGMFVGIGNGLPDSWLLNQFVETQPKMAVNSASLASIHHLSTNNAKQSYTKAEKHNWRKNLRQNLKNALKNYRENSKGKAGIIILIILGAILVTFLLMAISCSIACSGSGLIATLVFAGGLGLIIWACISLIRNVNRKNP